MKNNNKKKKVLPLLLALLLLISAGAYGTRAFFTDEEELKTSIEIKSGTLNIVVDNASWIYDPLKNGEKSGLGDKAVINDNYFINDKLTYTNSVNTTTQSISTTDGDGTSLGTDEVKVTNARPGDAFTRTITITNNGTLDVIIPNTFVADLTKQNIKSGNIDQRIVNGEPLFIATFTLDNNSTTGTITNSPDEILLTPNQVATYTMKIEVNHTVYYTSGLTADLDTVAKFALDNMNITAKQPNDGASYPNK